MKKTLILGLIAAGLNVSATEPVFKTGQSDFLNRTPDLFQRKTTLGSNPLKIKNTIGFTNSGSGKEWDEAEVSGGGFFLNVGICFIPSNYLNPYNAITPYYKTGFEFEFGNFFRFAKINDGQMGIGLRATWLSLTYSKYVDDKDIYRALQIRPIHLGPQFSYAISEVMGFDVFYQLGYNLTEQFGSIDDPIEKKNKGASWTYTGVSHEIGAAFHYKVFCLGLGYRMGKLNNISFIYDGKDYSDFGLDDKKSSINTFRVTVGFRF